MDREADQLRRFLAEDDWPCPSCNYNLRGLTSDKCPECNQRLILRVGLAEPRYRAFITAVIGLSAGTGFSGLLFLFFLFILHRDERPLLITVGVTALVEGLVLAILALTRRHFLRQSAKYKAWFAALTWLLTLAGFCAFLIAAG